MSNLRHRVGGKLEAMGDKLEAVEEKSKDFIHGFVGLFGRDGRIVSKKSFASTHMGLNVIGSYCTTRDVIWQIGPKWTCKTHWQINLAVQYSTVEPLIKDIPY